MCDDLDCELALEGEYQGIVCTTKPSREWVRTKGARTTLSEQSLVREDSPTISDMCPAILNQYLHLIH